MSERETIVAIPANNGDVVVRAGGQIYLRKRQGFNWFIFDRETGEWTGMDYTEVDPEVFDVVTKLAAELKDELSVRLERHVRTKNRAYSRDEIIAMVASALAKD